MRNITEQIESLAEQCRDLAAKKFSPACKDCGAILHVGQLRDTGMGFYEDGEVLCGFCKADRNHRAEQEIRTCAEPAVPMSETREANSR